MGRFIRRIHVERQPHDGCYIGWADHLRRFTEEMGFRLFNLKRRQVTTFDERLRDS
jgi:hypothetical protein